MTKKEHNQVFAPLFFLLVGVFLSCAFFLLVRGPEDHQGSLRIPPLAAPRPDFSELVRRTNGSVVSVSTRKLIKVTRTTTQLLAPREEEFRSSGAGSGFFFDSRGYVLTNEHVVSGVERITVRLADGREYSAHLVGSDPVSDLAILKVPGPDSFPVLPLGDSSRLRVGEWVVAIGDPLSFDHSVTAGVVSAKGRKVQNFIYDDLIQTDVAINQGNSGGPLLNLEGAVVGINSIIHLRGRGISFAIPINQAKTIVRQIMARGRVRRGYLGLEPREVDSKIQRALQLREPAGVVVVNVESGTPAERCGLRLYDVIVEFDGKPVPSRDEFFRLVAETPPGRRVQMKVVRDAAPLQLTTQLVERPVSLDGVASDYLSEGGDASKGRPSSPLGFLVADITREVQARFRLPWDQGVTITSIDFYGPAVESGLMEGSVIREINRKSVRNVKEFRALEAAARSGDIFLVYALLPRDGSPYLATVQVP
ncbi:MAG: trypsin-like peptidase domain-containing protein [Acidobacteria bacterium]|nr:trypsin-like peptidase domain-containing protein [Acidobacteriota bacterium]